MEDTRVYWPILKKACQITRKFKNLWFFGLFAAIVGGGELEILVRAISPGTQEGIFGSTINAVQAGWQDGLAVGGSALSNIWTAIINNPGSTILAVLILLITLIITLFIIWLAIVSQIGLVRNIDVDSKPGRKATISEGIDFATKNFWPILAVNAALKIILFILFLVLGWAIVLLIPYGWLGKIIYYLLFIVFIIIVITISFLFRYQICYRLLKKQKIMLALNSAWQLFKRNWLISLEMAFILFIVYCLAAFLTSLISILLLAVPFLLFFYYSLPIWLAITISFIVIVLLFVITFLITATFTAFQWSCWVLLFNRLTLGEALSKIVRMSQHIPQIPGYFSRK